MLRIEDLSKAYGVNKVLDCINLEFQKGMVYGIVGANGAGKTTLFRCIAGLEQFDGEVNSDSKNFKDSLGLLFTEPFFFPKITGEEYIQLLLNARQKKGVVIADKNIFDLPLDQYASTYSTGMKKKLALTAILLQQNDFFILDEPFNGVDIQSNLILVEIIKKLKDLGKTVIISSHIFSTLAETCNAIFVLDKGRVSKKVELPDFGILEAEMKAFSIGNRVDELGLL
ncbi:MAG: ABC-2 type transport system ATP-binding protein [Sphingobacteriales bacterium]|jgi:ABC-2 type transport system ATP-binding protein